MKNPSRVSRLERRLSGRHSHAKIPLITHEMTAKEAWAIYSAELRAPCSDSAKPLIDAVAAAQLYREACG